MGKKTVYGQLLSDLAAFVPILEKHGHGKYAQALHEQLESPLSQVGDRYIDDVTKGHIIFLALYNYCEEQGLQEIIQALGRVQQAPSCQ